MLWLTNHVIPAQEHFTSNIIRQKILIAIDSLPSSAANNMQIVLFTPEDEQHEIPLLFIYYLLKHTGKKVIYFGKSIKLNEIKEYADSIGFTHLLFHLVTNLTNMKPNNYVTKVSLLFPDKEIIMSGSQVEAVTQKPSNVRLLNSMAEILSFVKEGNIALTE